MPNLRKKHLFHLWKYSAWILSLSSRRGAYDKRVFAGYICFLQALPHETGTLQQLMEDSQGKEGHKSQLLGCNPKWCATIVDAEWKPKPKNCTKDPSYVACLLLVKHSQTLFMVSWLSQTTLLCKNMGAAIAYIQEISKWMQYLTLLFRALLFSWKEVDTYITWTETFPRGTQVRQSGSPFLVFKSTMFFHQQHKKTSGSQSGHWGKVPKV